ncbi:MAG: FecR domain-containing protein [Planctomycetota bacterium]
MNPHDEDNDPGALDPDSVDADSQVESGARAESDAVAPDDAELAALEDDLHGALGSRSDAAGAESSGAKPGAKPGGEGPSEDFRASLRAAFVSGQFEGDEEVGEPLETALRSWTPEPARPAARRAAQRALLEGWSEADDAAPDSVVRPAAAHRTRRAAGSQGRAAGAQNRGRRAAPAPARAASHRLRLLVGGSILAAAAAVVLLVRGGLGGDPAVPAPEWTLDVASATTLAGAGAIDGLQVDGESMADVAQLRSALDGGRRIQVGAQQMRILRGDRYVLELAAGTTVSISADGSEIVAESGSIRIATGPGFDPADPLAVVTPHVRAEVAGTVFGIDVGEDYSCVCCVEGSVFTEPIGPNLAALTVGKRETRVVKLEGTVETNVPDLHGLPLLALQSRVNETGYWL